MSGGQAQQKMKRKKSGIKDGEVAVKRGGGGMPLSDSDTKMD